MQTETDLWFTDKAAGEAVWGTLSSWDVSRVTSMDYLFEGRVEFNEDITGWDVSGVTSMRGMFSCEGSTWLDGRVYTESVGFECAGSGDTLCGADQGCEDQETQADCQALCDENVFCVSFEWDAENAACTISNFCVKDGTAWQTGGKNHYQKKFSKFSQPIGNWANTQALRDISKMFQGSSFNAILNGWQVGNVEDFSSTFKNAAYNADISAWNPVSALTMESMFHGAVNFNKAVNGWRMPNCLNMKSMFEGATSFNENMNSWNPVKVLTFENMFKGASAFNEVFWSSSRGGTQATTVAGMFEGATSFNRGLGFAPAAATNFSRQFLGATNFDKPINYDMSAADGHGRDV